MKAMVILNEQHSLTDDQVWVLDEDFDEFELYPVPADGWTLAEQIKHVRILESMVLEGGFEGETIVVVFASPIPAMIKLCMHLFKKPNHAVKIFHNDRREKEELPNGKIIHKVAKEGWQLV